MRSGIGGSLEAVGSLANASTKSPSCYQSWCVASKMSHCECLQNVHPRNGPKHASYFDKIGAQRVLSPQRTSISCSHPAARCPRNLPILPRCSQRLLLMRGEKLISKFSQMDIGRVCNEYEAALTSSSLINEGHPVVPETKRSEQKIAHHVRRASSSSGRFFVSGAFGDCSPSAASS